MKTVVNKSKREVKHSPVQDEQLRMMDSFPLQSWNPIKKRGKNEAKNPPSLESQMFRFSVPRSKSQKSITTSKKIRKEEEEVPDFHNIIIPNLQHSIHERGNRRHSFPETKNALPNDPTSINTLSPSCNTIEDSNTKMEKSKEIKLEEPKDEETFSKLRSKFLEFK
jgi:hypothetical protein